jgi:Acetyltransferase (GNAT) domain
MNVSNDVWHTEVLTPAYEKSYGELVAKAMGSPLSHTVVWRDVLLDLGMGEPIYWLAFCGNQLQGALPAFLYRSELGVVLNSLPFIQSTGGVISGADLGQRERAELVNLLIGSMLDWCCAHGVQVACVIGSAFGNHDDQASFPLQPSFRMERVIRANDLAQPLIFRPSVLEMIEKAQRFQPIMREATSFEEARLVYDIYAANMRRINVIPNKWTIYERIYARAASKGWTKFVWAEVGEEPVAGLIMMWHGDIVDYFSVGSTESGRKIQANSWLCNEQMRIAQAAGIRWWNWMASPSQQVYDFKKRWGGADYKYPIWGWQIGDISTWRKLSPAELATCFPGYFVLPYDWLSPSNG